MSHTTGPWHVSADAAHDCPDHKDSGLAMVDTGRSGDWPIARLVEWNNAKLIASAPELLEALHEARSFAVYMHSIFAHPMFSDRHDDAGRCKRMIARLDVALADAGVK